MLTREGLLKWESILWNFAERISRFMTALNSQTGCGYRRHNDLLTAQLQS